MRFTFPRWIPENAKEIKIEGINAVAYVYALRERFAVVAYKGKSNKNSMHYSGYKTEELATARATEFFNAIAQREAAKLQRRMDRKNYTHTLKVGDVLEYSWGYEQTNIEFFEVVAVPSTKSVSLRAIGQEITQGVSSMSEMVVAKKGVYYGEAFNKIVRPNNYIPMDHGCATLWDGRPTFQSHYA